MNASNSPWANPAQALAFLRIKQPKSCQQSCQQDIDNPSTEKGKSPCTPLRKKKQSKNIPIPTPACTCAREGDALKSESGSESGSVGLRQFDESESGSGLYKGPVDYGWIYDKAKDPVVVAMIALRIPKITVWNGNTYYNDKIMRRLMRQIGGDKPFRDLVHEQWCENDKDNVPRSCAAVFFAKLYARPPRARGGVQPHRQERE